MFEVISTKLAFALIYNEIGYQSIIRENNEDFIVITVRKGDLLVSKSDNGDKESQHEVRIPKRLAQFRQVMLIEKEHLSFIESLKNAHSII